MEKPLAVTGLRERLQRTIDHLRHLYYQNANIARKPTEVQVSASNWQRNALPCLTCGGPTHVNIVPSNYYAIGDPVCQPCHQKRIEAEILHNRQAQVKALYPYPGQLQAAMRHRIQAQIEAPLIPTLTLPPPRSVVIAGVDVRAAVHHALYPDISELETLPTKPPTGPLPARDIVLANTPPRAELFADVPTKAAWDHDEEGDPTQRRNAVPKITARIAGIDTTELILAEMARGLTSTHEQSTGENERLPQSQAVTWLL